MNKFLGKIYGPLVVLVDIALLVDICSDLLKRHKEKKAQKNIEVIDEEDPQPETAPEV